MKTLRKILVRVKFKVIRSTLFFNNYIVKNSFKLTAIQYFNSIPHIILPRVTVTTVKPCRAIVIHFENITEEKHFKLDDSQQKY